MSTADQQRQYEAFLEWNRRSGGSFQRYLELKDFDPADRRALLALHRKRAAA